MIVNINCSSQWRYNNIVTSFLITLTCTVVRSFLCKILFSFVTTINNILCCSISSRFYFFICTHSCLHPMIVNMYPGYGLLI